MTCDDVNGLIDLYACEACDPTQTRAVRDHLVDCDDCRQTLAETRQVQGLLEIHFGQEKSLKRLEASLRRETRPASASRHLLPFAKRFAAVAALVLIVFGLGTLLAPPQRPTALGPELQLALAPSREMVPMHGKPDRGHAKKADAVAKLRADLEAAKNTGEWPLPPELDLVIWMSNPATSPMEVQVGGPKFRCELDVRGPGEVIAEALDDPAFIPFPKRTETIPPGKRIELPIARLASQREGRVRYLYPTTPGEYKVRARLEMVVRTQKRERTVYLSTEPVVVRVP